jgi:hypothetical protein
LRNKPDADSARIPNSRYTHPLTRALFSSFARMRVPKFACETAYDAGFDALTIFESKYRGLQALHARTPQPLKSLGLLEITVSR